MKKTLGALVAIAALASITNAEARPGRYYDPGRDSIVRRQVGLGFVRIGDEGARRDADTIDVINRPGIECNLTHIQFRTRNDDVRILRVDLEYRNGARDSVSLDNNGYGYGRDYGRGLYIATYGTSGWLDIDAVEDGYPSGRCVDRITIVGMNPRSLMDNFFDRRGVDVEVTGMVADRAPRYEPRPDPYRPHLPPPHLPGRGDDRGRPGDRGPHRGPGRR